MDTEETSKGGDSDQNLRKGALLDKFVMQNSTDSEESQSEAEVQDPRPTPSFATLPRK